MKNSLLFDFTVDKATNMVYVKREFAADRELVWDAFTKQEILDQWWAPKPWASRTKHMNFENGGRRFMPCAAPRAMSTGRWRNMRLLHRKQASKWSPRLPTKTKTLTPICQPRNGIWISATQKGSQP